MTSPAVPAITSPDLDSDDALHWRNTFATVFGMAPATAEVMDAVRDTYRTQRLTGVRDDDRWVATFRSWAADSTVPGGALTGGDPADTRTVSSELVSSVSVAPTHRRRGLLTALMADCLDDARQRGATVATLFASEAAIYGRFGFGVATRVHDLTVDARAARTWHAGAPVAAGRVRLSDDDEIAAVGPDLFEAARLRMPGAVGRNEIGWRRMLERLPDQKMEGPRVRAVHVDADGVVDGFVRLVPHEEWTDGAPRYRASVGDLVGTDPAIVAALWRFCLDLDLVTTVVAEHRGHGELLPHLPVDTRAVRTTAAFDGHWWRVLDVPGALTARRWSAPGQVVLQVVDPGGPAEGRWSLDVDPDGEAAVAPTTRTADVTVPVHVLPAVLTGVMDLPVLHASGRLDEERAGAVRLVEAMSRVSPVGLGTVQGF